jgi:hypothetical protein
MTNYNIKLTPQLINLATEGGQDSSILNGKSYQRTFNMFEVENAGNRKVIGRVADGGEFNDTTFQNSSGIGTFEAGLTFTASQILDVAIDLVYDGEFVVGFVGAGAIIEITPEQSAALNSYGYPSLFFSAIWADGSENTNANLYVFSINGMQSGGEFSDIAGIAPFDEQLFPYCDEPTTWKMPVITTGFMFGSNDGPGFMQRTASDPHVIYELFKQVISQQEVDLEGKTPQEKADLIRTMLENLDDDHPLVVNLRKNDKL